MDKIKKNHFKSWKQNSLFLNKTLEYIEDITNPRSSNFVPTEDRIAVFDMDGTILTEKAPDNILFSLFNYRLNHDPSYKCTNPDIIQANEIVNNSTDRKQYKKALFMIYLQYITEVFKGLSDDEYIQVISNFSNYTYQPYNAKFKHLYFEPMREYIAYLQHNDFTCIINTGNEKIISYIFLSECMNIKLNHCIGTDFRNIHLGKLKKMKIYRYIKQSRIDKVLDVIAKDFNINKYKVVALKEITDKTPIMAFGNASVDVEMLDYSKESKHKSIQAMVIHDDIDSQLNVDLLEAEKMTKVSADKNYDTISVANDFKQLFPSN